jgi:hypothetical protein
MSLWKAVDSGVQQGSVLRPVLYIMYVKDITENVESFIKIFAGD